MMNTNSWFAMMRELRRRFTTGMDTILLNAGEAFGSDIVENSTKEYANMQERAHFLAQFASASGWGHFDYKIFPDGAIITSPNNAFADLVEKSSTPSCFFLKGIFQGIYNVILGEGTTVNETMCRSSGDPICQFEIKHKLH